MGLILKILVLFGVLHQMKFVRGDQLFGMQYVDNYVEFEGINPRNGGITRYWIGRSEVTPMFPGIRAISANFYYWSSGRDEKLFQFDTLPPSNQTPHLTNTFSLNTSIVALAESQIGNILYALRFYEQSGSANYEVLLIDILSSKNFVVGVYTQKVPSLFFFSLFHKQT